MRFLSDFSTENGHLASGWGKTGHKGRLNYSVPKNIT